MKTIDYINSLIKEKESLKELCKKHVETIHLIKRELRKLNNIISKKEKRIVDLESEVELPNVKIQKELDATKSELSKLKEAYSDLENKYNNVKPQKPNKTKKELDALKKAYDALQSKYNDVMAENEEYKRFFNDIENICDSD